MTERERDWEAETQAEGEAGSMRGARCGTPGPHPGLKATLNHWATGGSPATNLYTKKCGKERELEQKASFLDGYCYFDDMSFSPWVAKSQCLSSRGSLRSVQSDVLILQSILKFTYLIHAYKAKQVYMNRV